MASKSYFKISDKCPSKATKIGEVTVFPDLQEVRITIEVDNVASSYSNTSRINCETVKAWEKSKTSKFGNTPRPAKLPSRFVEVILGRLLLAYLL